MKPLLSRTFTLAALLAASLAASQARAQSLSPQAMASLAPLPRAQFIVVWDSLRAVDDRAAAAAPDSLRAREQARVRFRWAMGRVMHPYFHWRDGPATAVRPDPSMDRIARALRLESGQWDSLPEYRQFVDAYIHETARALVARDRALRTGDNRWLRAELQAVERIFSSAARRRDHAERLVAKHIEDNGAEGLDDVLARLRGMGLAPQKLAAILKARDEDLARREGHATHTYVRRDGVPLKVHVLEPTAPVDSTALRTAPRPAMLWLHGGSLNEGTWWHCPVICTALRANGVTVIAVEMRTGNRFESGPLEQLDDASAAMRWARLNATRIGVDPARLGVAGFSSGATVALMLASRDVESDPSPRPDAVIAMGACADPIAPHEDGFFRKRIAAAGLEPRDYSPLAIISSRGARGLPPVLAIHADGDEYCRLADIRAFVDLLTPGTAELTVIPDATHFFGFYHRPGQQRTRESIAAALARWGW